MSTADNFAPALTSEGAALEHRLQRVADGHLEALRVRLRVTEGGDPAELVEKALQSLAGDVDALHAFERGLERASLVAEH